jgi:hypothetical protein
MDPIERQNEHDDEVGNQDGRIERIPPVKTMEVVNLSRIVRLPIVTEAFGREKQRKESRRCMKKREQVDAPEEVPYSVDSTRYDAKSVPWVYRGCSGHGGN